MRESAWVLGEAREGRQLGLLLAAKRTEAPCSASDSRCWCVAGVERELLSETDTGTPCTAA
eukprot:1653361-Rhodomonas_salina.1